jgi:hypothetical protein
MHTTTGTYDPITPCEHYTTHTAHTAHTTRAVGVGYGVVLGGEGDGVGTGEGDEAAVGEHGVGAEDDLVGARHHRKDGRVGNDRRLDARTRQRGRRLVTFFFFFLLMFCLARA